MTEEVDVPPLPRRPWVGTVVALVLIAGGIVSAFIVYERRQMLADGTKAILEASPRRADELPVLGTVGDFALTDQNGRQVTLGSLLGRVWVAEYFFTYCGGPCPRMNRNLAELHREFTGKDEPKLVSITCDPKRDTLDVLNDHARTNQADTERWWFLRGEEKDLQQLASSLLLPYQIGVPSAHSTKFVLVDREGQIRGAYTGTDEKEVDALRRDLRALLASPPKG
jgi:protein SCO1/2